MLIGSLQAFEPASSDSIMKIAFAATVALALASTAPVLGLRGETPDESAAVQRRMKGKKGGVSSKVQLSGSALIMCHNTY